MNWSPRYGAEDGEEEDRASEHVPELLIVKGGVGENLRMYCVLCPFVGLKFSILKHVQQCMTSP